jgi:hypothetical protein
MDDKTFLLEQVARLRRLAREVLDERTEKELLALAAEYERRAMAFQDDGVHPTGCAATPA